MNKQLRQQVFNKYKKHCAYCGIDLINITDMQVDHIQPKVFNGNDDFDNLNPSCKSCNKYKCYSSLEEFRRYAAQMLNDKLEYLFKSKTKMQIAINFGTIKLAKWDGKFYFEILEERSKE